MARRESYSPLLKSYPDSDKINAVSEAAEVLYVRLIAQSDDAGRYWADPVLVLGKLFTRRMAASGMTGADVAERLTELWKVDLIRMYEVGGVRYLQLVSVFKKLRSDVAPQLAFPEPLEPPNEFALRSRDASVPLDRDRDREPIQSNPLEPANADSCSASDDPPTEPPVMSFPCVGKNNRDWHLIPSKVSEYHEAFPGVDVVAECRKALQWCRDNPRRRKTRHGMSAFLWRWLDKAQNGGRGGNQSPQQPPQRPLIDESSFPS